MALWRFVQLLAVVVASVHTAQASFRNDANATALSNGTTPNHRQLGSTAAVGNVAVCYTPFHNNEYPLFGGTLNLDALRSAIDNDFSVMSKYFTHVRTYYAQHFGIEIAPIAAKYGLKLYLGAYLTTESWWSAEADAAANAIKNYPGTVEVVFTGNENLANFQQRSWDIINKINDIKSRAGSAAGNVKYGTVQRINEFVDSRFDWDMQQLNNALDILGVNIYPFFTNSYDGSRPTALLDAQWNQVTSKYPSDKIRLTETGYPTAGSASSQAPSVYPGLDASINYYNGVIAWTPSGYENKPKFWFQAFDRRYGDPGANGHDYELYFGFLTTAKQQKRDGFPRTTQAVVQSRSASCDIEENVDYSGSDVGSKAATQAESCFAICNAFSGCGAFTWSSYNGGTCWLKSGKGSSSSNNGMRSGVACSSPPTTSCSIDENTDYSGTDVGSRPGTQAESCFSICDAFSGCSAFTWSSYNGGTCWLKASMGSARTSSGARSGIAGGCTVTSTSLCSVEENTDYTGADIGNKPSTLAEACFGLCNAFSGCGAFTWSSYNGGTCWFKSSKGSSKTGSGARSGVACQCNLGGMESGVDYSGPDVGNAYGASAVACISLCQAKSGCRAFTWTNYNGGTCWFKSSKGSTKTNSAATSGVIC